MEHFLNRDDSPFQEKTWQAIDEAVIGAARSQLSARKLLTIDGPYGLGLKSVPLGDQEIQGEAAEGVTISGGNVIPLLSIQATFRLAARDIAGFEERGDAMDLGAAVNAAIAVARQEDAIIFKGSKGGMASGLLNLKGVQYSDLKPWEQIGAAAEDVISGVTKLDTAGFHGPYTLALTPDRYNLLFRRFPQGNGTELDQIRSIITDGVVKASEIGAGGVLVAAGAQFSRIVIGQDIMAGFVGPAGTGYEFTVSESLALRVTAPGSILILK